ncbi:MAG: NAD(P)H-hydrate dehydratase [Oscillospiraceae bacterium]|nr:NAD(P)H-hydrate dehydratase [Oscillospiraceae bacterium]
MRIVTGNEMKKIEENCLDFGLSFHRLMENAGCAASAFLKRTFKVNARNCAIFCGKGNNGGDGFVVARKLAESDVNTIVILLDGQPAGGEALAMYRQLEGMGVPIYEFAEVKKKLGGWLEQTDLVVDAICGTGFKGRLRESHRYATALINGCTAVVVSLDLPSGVECDSGQADEGAVQADYTLAFDSLKPCHILPGALPFCGKVEQLDIGIPDEARQRVEPCCDTLTLERVFELIPHRAADSHKGTFGRVLCIAGSARYRGAATLCAAATLRCGAGIVTLASTEQVCACAATHLPEATFLPLVDNSYGSIDSLSSMGGILSGLEGAGSVAFGPGLGDDTNTIALLEYVLDHARCPVVLDADGINVLAENIHLLKRAKAPFILTPHPGEMARLCEVTIGEIQQNREGYALSFAKEHGVYLLLKGARTVIASPEGKLLRVGEPNSGLAKGGSGDVLTGMIAALIAQGLSAWDGAGCGAFLHSMAAGRTASRRSQTAMLPSEILEDLAGIFLDQGR